MKVDTTITKALIANIVLNDYNKLMSELRDMPFEQAFKNLDGYNLSAIPYKVDEDRISIKQLFDFDFGTLNGTIYKDNTNGNCELRGNFFVLDKETEIPVAEVFIDKDGNVRETEILTPFDITFKMTFK